MRYNCNRRAPGYSVTMKNWFNRWQPLLERNFTQHEFEQALTADGLTLQDA